MPTLTGKTQFIKEAGKGTADDPFVGYTSFVFEPDGNKSVPGSRPAVIPDGTRWFHLYFTFTGHRKQRYKRLTVFGEFRQVDAGMYVFGIRNKSSVDKNAKFKPGTEKFITRQLRNLYRWQRAITAEEKSLLTELRWHEERKKCDCTYESIQDWADARLVGSIYVVYSFDFFNYIAKEERKNVRKLFVEYDRRSGDSLLGGLNLAGIPLTVGKEHTKRPAIRNQSEGNGWKIKPLIDISDRERDLINDGDKFSIFRRRLKRRWLIEKTYKLDMGDGQESYKVCLMKAGLIEVRKKVLLYDKERDTLLGVLRGLLRHRTTDPISERDPASPIDVAGIVDVFASQIKKAVNKKLKSRGVDGPIKPFSEADIEKKAAARANRQKYVIILLSNILCSKCDKTIPAAKIHDNQDVVAAFLQGSLIFDEMSPTLQLPSIPARLKERIMDQSTWTDEFCVFGGERCLIYFQPKTVMESPRYVANYEDYWRSVVRGIEHTISVRTTLQILEAYTHELIGRIPDLMKTIVLFKANSKSADPKDYAALTDTILELADDVAHAIEILPKLRDVCVPSSAFRSGHAIEKFTFLNEKCFHFSAILENIQQNIDELTNFLLFFKQQQLEMAFDAENKKREKRDDTLSFIAVIFTIATVYYVFPSFLHDFSEFWSNHCFLESYCGSSAKLIAGLGFVSYIGVFAFLLSAAIGLIYRDYLREHQLYKRISRLLKNDFGGRLRKIFTSLKAGFERLKIIFGRRMSGPN